MLTTPFNRDVLLSPYSALVHVRLALQFVLGKQIGRWRWRGGNGINFSEILQL